MQQTIAYEEADDITREQMVRDINKEFGVKEKRAPSVEKLGLKEKAKKVLIDSKKLLDERLVEIDQSIKEGQRNFKTAVKDLATEIKAMLPKGIFSTSQVKVITNAMASNLLNPKLRQDAVNRVIRVVNNVAEATKLKEVYSLRTKIKEINTKNLATELVDIVKGFARIDPRYIEDIDKHLEESKKIFDAIKNVKVKKDDEGNMVVDPRSILNYQSSQDYIQKQLDKQDEILKDALLEQYANLVAEGKINGSMSLNQIQDYVKSLEKDPENNNDEKDQALRDFAQQSFDESKEELIEDLKDGYIDPKDAKLIEAFTKIDLSLMTPMSAYEAAEALMNYRMNGSTSNMGKVASDYIGALGIKTITENITREGKVNVGGTRYQAYKAFGKVLDTAIKVLSFGKLKPKISEKLGDLYSKLWFEYNSTMNNLGTTFFGPNNWDTIKEASGLDQIIKGVVERKVIIEQFRKEIHDKYKDKKIGKDNVFTTKNAVMLDVIANLYRQTSDPKQKDTYFNKRKKVLKETIDYLNSSEDSDYQKQGKLLEEIYNELDIENATSGKEIFDNADPVAKEVINDFINKFKEYYPEFSQIAQEQFNIILGQDTNYTSDSWRNVGKVVTSSSDKLFRKGNFRTNVDIVETEPSGRFIKPKYPDGLPTKNGKVSRIPSYDFFQNNMDALAETINTVKTIAGVNQYVGFVDSPYFEKLIKNEESRKLFKDRIDYNVSLLQMDEKIGKREGITRGIVDFFRIPMKMGTTVGLSSAESVFTQSIPILANTRTNLRNPEYLIAALQYPFNTDMQNFLNNINYGIRERGVTSQTNIDYAENMLEKGDYSTSDKTLETLKEYRDFLVNKALVGTDVLTAKTTWMAYYMDALDEQGIDPMNIDWNNHEVNDEAAKYAEKMQEREQNINLSEIGGKLWSSKDSRIRLARMGFPFASFTTSQKDKIKANMAVLFMDNNLATREEKIAAAKSIVSSAGEQYMFNLIKTYIASTVTMGAYNIVKKKETEEEKQLREKKAFDRNVENIFDTFSGSNTVFEKELDALTSNFIMRASSNLYDIFEDAVKNNMTFKEFKNKMAKANWFSDKEKEKKSKIYPSDETSLPKSQAKLKGEGLKKEIKKPFRFRKPPETGPIGTTFSILDGVPKVAYDTWIKVISKDVPDIFKGATTKDGEEAKLTKEETNKLLGLLPVKIAGILVLGREVRNLADQGSRIIKDSATMRAKRKKAAQKRMNAEMNN